MTELVGLMEAHLKMMEEMGADEIVTLPSDKNHQPQCCCWMVEGNGLLIAKFILDCGLTVEAGRYAKELGFSIKEFVEQEIGTVLRLHLFTDKLYTMFITTKEHASQLHTISEMWSENDAARTVSPPSEEIEVD